MSVLCALSAGSIYYSQVMVDALASSFRVAPSSTAWMSSFSQAGYVAGLALLVPLGDRFEKRGLIALVATLGGCALLLAAVTTALPIGFLAATLIGVFATVASLTIPMAASLTEPAKRGQVIGWLMLGLLGGIVASRLVSGIVTEVLGWRTMFAIAACGQFMIALLILRYLPQAPATTTQAYRQLLSSLLFLYRSEPALRLAGWRGALLFAAFSGFWATFSLHVLAARPAWGAIVPGLFGIAGIVGAFVAPAAGRLADTRGPNRVFGYALFCAFAALLVLIEFQSSMVGQAVGIVALDVGVQTAMVCNQTVIYALQPAARTRINSVYMIIYFAGGTLGAGAALALWGRVGWPGVLIACCIFTAGSGAVHTIASRRAQR